MSDKSCFDVFDVFSCIEDAEGSQKKVFSLKVI